MKKLQKLNKKQIVLNLVTAVLILCAFFYVLNFFGTKQKHNRKEDVSKNLATSNGKIIDESYMKGHSVKYQFTYKGQYYETWMSDYDEKFKVGKCYLVWLDSTDPNISIIKLQLSINCP